MPLYETIVICRAGASLPTKKMIKIVANSVFKQNGTLRDARVLGDRIMSRTLRGQDYKTYKVGRYVQFLYDAHPDATLKVERAAKGSYEYIWAATHRVDDYMKESLAYKRAASMVKPIVSERERNDEFLNALRQFKESQES